MMHSNNAQPSLSAAARNSIWMSEGWDLSDPETLVWRGLASAGVTGDFGDEHPDEHQYVAEQARAFWTLGYTAEGAQAAIDGQDDEEGLDPAEVMTTMLFDWLDTDLGVDGIRIVAPAAREAGLAVEEVSEHWLSLGLAAPLLAVALRSGLTPSQAALIPPTDERWDHLRQER